MLKPLKHSQGSGVEMVAHVWVANARENNRVVHICTPTKLMHWVVT